MGHGIICVFFSSQELCHQKDTVIEDLKERVESLDEGVGAAEHRLQHVLAQAAAREEAANQDCEMQLSAARDRIEEVSSLLDQVSEATQK
jgi:hypothetical protein